ncbi:MAG: hypothetical protein E7399_01475 [Ruminococcaceae bacterium]|nr:hypothetical protein [Oscillospiraceae bacterium]
MDKTILSIRPGEGIRINGRQPEKIIKYSIYQDGYSREPRIEICYEDNLDVKGLLISENAELIRCSKCGILLGYSINGTFLKARCDNCDSMVKCR